MSILSAATSDPPPATASSITLNDTKAVMSGGGEPKLVFAIDGFSGVNIEPQCTLAFTPTAFRTTLMAHLQRW
jgi:hypothetical protein